MNEALREASKGAQAGILAVVDEPLVSVDFRCTDVSTSIDSSLTMVMGARRLLPAVPGYSANYGQRDHAVGQGGLSGHSLSRDYPPVPDPDTSRNATLTSTRAGRLFGIRADL